MTVSIERVCPKCNVCKTVFDFTHHQRACRSCQSARAKARRHRLGLNKPKEFVVHANPRNRWKHQKLMEKYGITFKQFNSIMQMQNNCCAGCGIHVEEYIKLKGHTLDVDHCHITKVVRGLLCRKCNEILARCNDNPSTLKNLILYLGQEPAINRIGGHGSPLTGERIS